MITIKDFMECVEYKISDGYEYQWGCYGPNARAMSYDNGKQGDENSIVYIVFDTKTQFVYEMQAWDGHNNKEYRWIHPGYIEGHAAEAKRRGIDFKESCEFSKFVDLELPEDMLEKASAIYREEDYDERIMVRLDLDQDSLFLLMEMAHEADLSLNQFVEHILREDMKKHGIEV